MAFFVPPLSSRGLGHQVLILVTRVRIPLGVPCRSNFECRREVHYSNEREYFCLSSRLRSMLCGAVDLLADSRNAGWKTGRDSLCESGCGIPLSSVREAGAAGALRFLFSRSGDVRELPGRGARVSGKTGNPDGRKWENGGRITGFIRSGSASAPGRRNTVPAREATPGSPEEESPSETEKRKEET